MGDGWRQKQQCSVPASSVGIFGLEAELPFKSDNKCLLSDSGQ